ncbi:MAG: UDP-2,3-diacylglucosamine diphosphatase LpxI [Verrucomicrobia bacterium]|nr:UDP-2,3-diacylglucosamine diphosphatase LpxI [Verrucomicrobiota bacterium]MDA1086261.1 UDP-2,3-diacylglucosamine diphosphatase LpxI [Verrucomicrobiota bacterium]
MTDALPDELGLIAGRGTYPTTLAESARGQGIKRLVTVAFEGETDKRLEALSDETTWIRVGQLESLLDALRDSGVKHAVMAGQLAPTKLFKVRMDKMMRDLLQDLPERNAQTIFGAIGDRLADIGIELLPASVFMESAMPAPGPLSARHPTECEQSDIELGIRVAKETSGLDIGQTVVVKEGTILAVEAFEGTDAAIERAGKLGGPGAVVIKMSKDQHDMRFDIPVIGIKTIKLLARIKAGALAVEAGRSIILEQEDVMILADRHNIAVIAIDTSDREVAHG